MDPDRTEQKDRHAGPELLAEIDTESEPVARPGERDRRAITSAVGPSEDERVRVVLVDHQRRWIERVRFVQGRRVDAGDKAGLVTDDHRLRVRPVGPCDSGSKGGSRWISGA